MRRYLLPLVVLGAIGALVVLLVKMGEEPPKKGPVEVATEEPKPKSPEKDGIEPWEGGRTALDENRWMRELERVLERDDLSKAYFFRGKICEEIDRIAEHGKLSKNLLETIRKYGLQSDDPKRRDVLIPILRVFAHPEATAMIEEAYYSAPNEDEQMVLLEAMTHAYHDPGKAVPWVIEKALNSENPEHRNFAFRCLYDYSENPALIVDTANQILSSTTDMRQKKQMYDAMTDHAQRVPRVAELLRPRLKSAHGDEFIELVARIDSWGSEEDAVYLEGMAMRDPAMSEMLEDRAEAIRTRLMEKAEEKMTPEERAASEERRMREQEERERIRAEERAKAAGETLPEEPSEPEQTPPSDGE